MGLFKMAAVGAVGYFAYQALQRKQANSAALGNDRSEGTAQRLVSDISDATGGNPQGSMRTSQGNSAP